MKVTVNFKDPDLYSAFLKWLDEYGFSLFMEHDYTMPTIDIHEESSDWDTQEEFVNYYLKIVGFV